MTKEESKAVNEVKVVLEVLNRCINEEENISKEVLKMLSNVLLKLLRPYLLQEPGRQVNLRF